MDRDYLDAMARRARSHQALAQSRLPVPHDLPCLAPLSAIQVPSIGDVVRRAAAVACITYRTHLPADRLADLDDFMLAEGIFPMMTGEEKALYFSPAIEERPQLAFFSWCIESCHVLFWALQQMDRIDYPDAATHPDRLFHLFFAGEFAEFRDKARLRFADEILDAADLYFRYRAICRDASANGNHPPGMLDPTIVHMRYGALLWLIGRGTWDNAQDLAWSS